MGFLCGFWEVGFSQKSASTKYQEAGFLNGILKVGFVEKYGLGLGYSKVIFWS